MGFRILDFGLRIGRSGQGCAASGRDSSRPYLLPPRLLSPILPFRSPALLLALVLLAGCSGPLVRNAPDAAAPADFPNHSAEQVLALLAAQPDTLRAFSSQSRVEIRAPGRNADATATIRQRAADTLWASLQGPFGIEGGRVLLTPDSVKVLDKINGRLYLGRLDALAAYVPGSVSTQHLFDTLLGLLRPDGETAWSLRADPRYYHLTDPGGRRVYTVDPALWRIVRYTAFGPDGATIDERVYSGFDQVAGVVVPRRVVLRSPTEDVSVTIEHRRLTLNPPSLAFPFSPGSAERYTLD